MKRMLLLYLVFGFMLAACGQGTVTASPEETPAETTVGPMLDGMPEPTLEPLVSCDATTIESVCLIIGGADYALTAKETASILELLSETEPTFSSLESADSMDCIELRYSNGSVDALLFTPDKSTFYRMTDDGGVQATAPKLGEYIAALLESILEPQIDAGEIVFGSIFYPGWESKNVVHIEDIARRTQALIDSGSVVPFKHAEYATFMSNMADVHIRTTSLFNSEGETVLSLLNYAGGTNDAACIWLDIGGHPYRIDDDKTKSDADLIIRNAQQTVYLDVKDPNEYVFSNGLKLGMTADMIIATMGWPDSMEAIYHEDSAVFFYAMKYKSAVLCVCMEKDADGSIPDLEGEAELHCVQLLGDSIHTNRDIAPGDSLEKVFEAYGIEVSPIMTRLNYFYESDSALYDGEFSISANFYPGISPTLLFLYKGDSLASIVLRRCDEVYSFLPLY